MSSALSRLEAAAGDVIQILKGINEFQAARIAVIGGLALLKYNPLGRTTEDVDFIININSAPQGVKQKLLALPNSPFLEQAQFFFYRAKDGSYVQIDITAEWQSPYMPAAAAKLKDIPAGVVPYISATDLVVFKINSCGLRAQAGKRRVDAGDAQILLETMTAAGPLRLTTAQRAVVEAGLESVIQNGRKNEAWWRERLGFKAGSPSK